MPDLNKLMLSIQKNGSDVEKQLKNLFGKYEDFYREGNRQFLEEKTATSGSMDGLEDFYRLIQTVRRNKDVIGSLIRGFNNLRSLSNFKFIEEEVSKPVKPKKALKRQTAKPAQPTQPESVPVEEIGG